MPPDLIAHLSNLIRHREAVIFVDASLPAAPSSAAYLADSLATALDAPPAPLPMLAQQFQQQTDRQQLVQAVQRAYDTLAPAKRPAYKYLARLLRHNSNVITTHIDRPIERQLDTLQKPYSVLPLNGDIAATRDDGLTLIKLQGDVTQPASLALTDDDLELLIARTDTLTREAIRTLFAARPLIYLGASVGQSRLFRHFYFQVIQQRDIQRNSYALVTECSDDADAWFQRDLVIHPIEDMTALLRELAQAVEAEMTPVPPLPPPPRQPYLALESFSRDDAALFAGRSRESSRLTAQILNARLTILYGESGSGKTSLLNAGVAPRLAEERIPLIVATASSVRPLLADIQPHLDAVDWPDSLPISEISDVDSFIAVWQAKRGKRNLVLALDQFEQALLSPRDDLAQNLNRLLATEGLHLVLIVREDFLGRLDSLKDSVPGLLDVRFRLDRLDWDAARAAIEAPTQYFDFTWEPTLLYELLQRLQLGTPEGILPPQLQLVCDHLYQTAAARVAGPTTITLAHFKASGGIEAILHTYLDSVMSRKFAADQTVVKQLLGALVHTSRVKQRLTLAELRRMVSPDQASDAELEQTLITLIDTRLVQRYQQGDDIALELAHDYLVPRIIDWLGDAFWARQKARELVQTAPLEWTQWRRLPAPDDLHLISQHRAELKLTPGEYAPLYAAAVAYNQPSDMWAAHLTDADRRRILRRLLMQDLDTARAGAVRALAPLADEEIAQQLAEYAVLDPAPSVREAAAYAIAQLAEPLPALAYLMTWFEEYETARDALVIIRDVAPRIHRALLPSQRESVVVRVWWRRWQRHRPHIQGRIIRAAQGGFLSLGPPLIIALAFGVREAQILSYSGDLLWTLLPLLLCLALPITGVAGAITVSGAAFTRSVLRHIFLDNPMPGLRWCSTTLAGGLLLGLYLMLIGMGLTFGQPDPEAFLAGFLLGLLLVGGATLPITLTRFPVMLLTGAAAFWLVNALGLFFGAGPSWLLLILGALTMPGLLWAFPSEGTP